MAPNHVNSDDDASREPKRSIAESTDGNIAWDEVLQIALPYSRRLVGECYFEDVAQDAIVDFLKALRDGRPVTNNIALLRRIVLRRGLDSIRRKYTRAGQRAQKAEDIFAGYPAAEDWHPVECKETLDRLYASLEALPDNTRAVVYLHFLCGFSLTTTAKELGISKNQAAYQCSCGLKFLRGSMGDNADKEGRDGRAGP